MNSLQPYVLALSRVLTAMIFLLNGLGIISQAGAAKELVEHGAPTSLVPFLMISTRTLEVVGGFAFALGIYPRLAAVALLAFLIPATFTAHPFWQVVGTAYTPMLLNFLKNTAMIGGLLFIAATPSQPTVLTPRSRSNGGERTRDEMASRNSERAA
jgi:putative oxidoreductase